MSNELTNNEWEQDVGMNDPLSFFYRKSLMYILILNLHSFPTPFQAHSSLWFYMFYEYPFS